MDIKAEIISTICIRLTKELKLSLDNEEITNDAFEIFEGIIEQGITAGISFNEGYEKQKVDEAEKEKKAEYNEKRVDYYIKAFKGGAMRTVAIDPKYWTARNAPREKQVEDIKYYVEQFVKEDFNEVQKQFWKWYKLQTTGIGHIKSKDIYSAIKALKNKS